ncbi:putative Metallo-beta-lactamase domain-containing protein [Seiridium unicorne]|uniref:Metallo-beta-lactamase domain-containing protein n=1 Tax=Seiridium unicorne TaxID=138068 RepID=A0ABR2UUV5_9PEZI
MAVSDTVSSPESPKATQHIVRVSDGANLRSALSHSSPPVLIHLNADTTWLLSLPYPPSTERSARRTRYNILLDPWFQGPQSDVASWFSTQWHLVAPSVQTIEELNGLLAEVEQDDTQEESQHLSATYIDVVAISHEFTDHCHEATLKELPRSTLVFATEKAAELIESWKHFDTVVTTPGFSSSTSDWQKALSKAPLPSWVGIGRVITEGNALYYHSAVIIAFKQSVEGSSEDASGPGAVLYSPHGIKGSDLNAVKGAGINTLALLHGLHDVRIWMTKQLNLGALNGLEAVRASGAKYWIATHDEIKKGGGFIAPLLRRTKYTVSDAVKKETKSMGEKAPDYNFVELGSGDGLILA